MYVRGVRRIVSSSKRAVRRTRECRAEMSGASTAAASSEGLDHPMKDVWEQRKLVRGMFKCRSKEDAAQLKEKLMRLNTPLSAEAADRSIRNLSRLGMGTDAMDVFERACAEAKANNSIPEERVFIAAMNACTKEGNHEQSEKIFLDLKSVVGEEGPSSKAYLSVMNAFAVAEQSSKAEALLNDIKMTAGTSATTSTEDDDATESASEEKICASTILRAHNLAIHACNDGDESVLERIEESLREFADICPDDDTHNATIVARYRAGNWSKVLESMQGLLDSRVKARPSRESLRSAVLAATELGDWEAALQYEHFMRKIALPVDDDIAIACMRACNDAEEWKETLLVFDRMIRKKRPPTEAYSLVRVACVEGKYTTDAKLWGLFD